MNTEDDAKRMTDAELLQAFEQTTGRGSDAEVLLAEIQRRKLDI
ncbi:hypothetical protein [Sphingomonas sp. Leaf17]|nr:hypothetical protein [Sphingomonas sp. Leaf17]